MSHLCFCCHNTWDFLSGLRWKWIFFSFSFSNFRWWMIGEEKIRREREKYMLAPLLFFSIKIIINLGLELGFFPPFLSFLMGKWKWGIDGDCSCCCYTALWWWENHNMQTEVRESNHLSLFFVLFFSLSCFCLSDLFFFAILMWLALGCGPLSPVSFYGCEERWLVLDLSAGALLRFAWWVASYLSPPQQQHP